MNPGFSWLRRSGHATNPGRRQRPGQPAERSSTILKTSPPAFEPRTIVLFGIPFHDVTMAETLEQIDRLVAERKPAYLVTANLDFAAQASEDVELQRILVEAEMVLCDGTPLVWASRLTGKPLRERVAGSDLVPKLAAHAANIAAAMSDCYSCGYSGGTLTYKGDADDITAVSTSFTGPGSGDTAAAAAATIATWDTIADVIGVSS